MLCLSQATWPEFLALSCLENADGQWVKVRDVHECTGIPMPSFTKLFHHLVQVGIVLAKRGSFGGYALTVSPSQTSLVDIAEAVEGRAWLPTCLLDLSDCSEDRARPMHSFWNNERARTGDRLAKVSINDVAQFEGSQRENQCSTSKKGRCA